MRYGLIAGGDMLLSDVPLDGYKPITYATVPVYDQETQYVIQLQPVERESGIYVGAADLHFAPTEWSKGNLLR
jgi:hypothetical protein